MTGQPPFDGKTTERVAAAFMKQQAKGQVVP